LTCQTTSDKITITPSVIQPLTVSVKDESLISFSPFVVSGTNYCTNYDITYTAKVTSDQG